MKGVLKKRDGIWCVKWADKWQGEDGPKWNWTPVHSDWSTYILDSDAGDQVDFELVWSKDSVDFEARILRESESKGDGLVIPKFPGGYYFGKDRDGTIALMLNYRPGPVHRLFMRWLLGLYWYDNN